MADAPIDILSRIPLFKGAARATLQLIAAHSVERNFAVGEVIFRYGEPGQTMLVVLAGVVQIGRVGASGQGHVLRLMGHGQFFGEIALLDGGLRTADAVAHSNVKMLEFGRADILAAIGADPVLALGIVSLLCQRLRSVDLLLESMVFHDFTGRLALTLLAAARDTHNQRIYLTQQVLGEMTRATRETVNRKLREWQTAGLVALEPGVVRLINLPGLRAMIPGDETI